MNKDKGRFGERVVFGAALIAALAAQTPIAAAGPENEQHGASVRKARLIAAPSGDEASCKAVFDAIDKAFDVPNHQYLTQEPNKSNGGKGRQSEMITTGGSRYILVNGKWHKGQTVADVRAQEAENKKNAKNYSCKQVGTEMVGAEPASVYTMHEETDDTKSDAKIWISKIRGLPLKEDAAIDTGGSEPSRWSTRYEYGNVTAPQI